MKSKNRNKAILVRLSEDEFKDINKRVALTGLSREEYMRSLMRMEVPSSLPSPDMIETIKQLRLIGNNINQLTVIAYKTGSIDIMKYKNDYERLQNQILKIITLINQPTKLEEIKNGNNKDMGSQG
ncbi:MAG: plasmid mobilization relaxosome protein MobC [Erysipelotrichaceae bacterium]|nr:plasmid mobilization relaxosome protein MobC [Erysipelotrichaceae bacterium]